MSDATPADERRLRRWGRWAVKPFLRLPPVADPFTGFRLVRISVLRELLRALGSRPVCAGDGWAANIDFALNVAPFARRIENVEFAPRYDVRQRASRRRGWADVMALFHWARSTRGTARPVPGSKAAAEAPGRQERAGDVSVIPVSTDRSNRTSERQGRDRTERSGRPDRDRNSRSARAADATEDRGARSTPDVRGPRVERPDRQERPERQERAERQERPAREEQPARAERPAREERGPRPDRPPRAPRPEPAAAEPDAAADLPQEPVSVAGEGAAGLGGASDAADVAESPTPTGEKKSRRRRRRSRRDRAERGGGDDTTGPTVSRGRRWNVGGRTG
ncbi:MAG: hypothetical protein U5K74_05870 [Gemmatimonadaceae bacterium]|nr:hypothetical protein [Gemmatimonadaceae bacterium]